MNTLNTNQSSASLSPMQRIILLLAIAGLIVVACNFTGCATANGFGKDMEGAGKDIQKETR
jgi:predicted small secreted protein